jgi:hypothetical protein
MLITRAVHVCLCLCGGQWGRLGLNLKGFPPKGAAMAALVFHGAIAAMFFVLFLYWLHLTIFEALAYLSVLGVVALFSGKTTLAAIAQEGQH